MPRRSWRIVSYFRPRTGWLEVELRTTYGSALTDAVDRFRTAAVASTLSGGRTSATSASAPRDCNRESNVMVSRGRVTLIDFQDLIWGFEIQDVEIACGLGHFDSTPTLATRPFGAGYELGPADAEGLDAERVEALQAARHLNVLNFGLGAFVSPGARPVHRAERRRPVVEWMGSGGELV